MILKKEKSNPTCSGLTMVANSSSFKYDDTLYNVSNEVLKKLVVERGMITVGIDGSKLQLYKSGILDGQSCTSLNHAVSLFDRQNSSIFEALNLFDVTGKPYRI